MLIGLGIWIMLTFLLKLKWSIKLLFVIMLGCMTNTFIDIFIFSNIAQIGGHTLAYLTLPIIVYWTLKAFKYNVNLGHWMLIVFMFTLVQLISVISYLFSHQISYLVVAYATTFFILYKWKIDNFWVKNKELNSKMVENASTTQEQQSALSKQKWHMEMMRKFEEMCQDELKHFNMIKDMYEIDLPTLEKEIKEYLKLIEDLEY